MEGGIIYSVLLQPNCTWLDGGDRLMKISYNKLFKLLIDKNMKKKELCEKAGISSSTIVKMGRQEPVSVELIGKICLALGCTANDVLEFLPDEDSVKAWLLDKKEIIIEQ